MKVSFAPQFLFEGTLTFASVGANATAEQTVTLPAGVTFPNWPGSGTPKDSSFILLALPSLQAGLTFSNAYVVSQNTFKVRFTNSTAGALTPAGTNAQLVML